MKDLSGEITRLSTSLGVSSNKLAEVAQVLAQAGLSAKDTKIALDALAKSELSPTFEDIGQTTEGAIAIFQQFGKEAKDLEGILGSLNAVSGKFAVESSDLISAVRRTGGAFKAAGGDLNELAALFTSVRATTRESAESIATGFRTIFTRIQRPRTINFLRELGVELTDLKGQFVGPLEAVRRLSIALEKIPSTDIRFAQVVEELGGFRQVSKVIPLIQQFKVTQQALAVAQTGTTSLADDAAKAQSSLAVQITKVKEEFLALVREFSNDTTFRNIVDLALKLASAFIKVADAVRPLAPALATIGSIALGKAASKAVGSFGSSKGFLGNIFKFAKGGIVPGSGHGDTVPAMLQPGEFVLRKKAVQAIGPENVAKFNTGGFVQKFASGGSVFNQIKDFGKFNKQVANSGINPDLLLSSNQKDFELGVSQLRSKNTAQSNKLANFLENKAFVAAGSTKTGEGISVRSGTRLIEIGGNSPEFGGLFLRPLDSRDRTVQQTFPFRSLANDVQDKIAFKLGKQPKTLNRASVAANLDFGFIEKETSKIFDQSAQGKIIDAAESLIKDFNPFGTISRDTVAKITRKSNFEGALGSLFEAFTASVADVPPASRTSQQNFDIPNAQGVRDKLSHLFGNFPETVKAADVKLSATNSNIKSIVKKAARYAAFDGGVRVRDIGTIKENIASNIISPRTGEKIAKKASGGPAGGDTVPALLTPGEFVLDRDTVKRVGLPTLNRLNRKGFNKGGFVGRYAAGGAVNNAFSPTGFLGASVLLQTVQQFAGLNDEMGKLISSVSSAAIQASVFTTAVKQSSFVTEKQAAVEKAQTIVEAQRGRVKRTSISALQAGFPELAARNRLNKPGHQATLSEFNTFIDAREAADKRRKVANQQKDLLKQREKDLSTAKSRLNRSQLISSGLGVGAGVAVTAGDLLSRQGAESIQAGGTSKTASGLGGALSGGAQGALIGATIGSIVPVIGTAIGGIAGGVIGAGAGLVSALTDAANQIEDVKFGKTVEEFNLQLKKGISSGGGNGTSVSIRTGLNEIAKRIATTSGEDKVAAEGAAKASLPELQQFFDSVAKNSKTFNEFEKTVSRGTLALFSSFSKIPFEDVRKQYEAQIKSQQAAVNAQNSLIKATDEFALRIKNTTALSKAIDETSVSLKGFSDTLLSEGAGGVQDISSILGGAGNITDSKRFESLVKATGNSFGPAGQQTASDSIAANRVLSELPSVLLGLKDLPLLDENAAGDFVDILKDRLTQATGNDQSTRTFVNLVGSKAGGIIGGEGKPQKLQERLREDFEGTIKELSSGLTFASEIMVKQFNHIAERGKFLSDSLAKVTALTIESVDHFNEALDIDLQRQEFNAGQVPNAQFSAAPTENIIRQQLGNITGKITVGGANSVFGLGNILRDAQTKLLASKESVTADSLAARGVTNLQAEDTTARKSQAELASNAQFAAKALQFVATSSQKLAAAKQQELSAIEDERKSRLSLVQEFAFGGPEARLNISENSDLINRIQKGSVSVQQLDPASLQKLGSFIDKLNPNTVLGNGQKAADFKLDLTRQLAVGQAPVIGGQPGELLTNKGFTDLAEGGDKEKQLRQEINSAFSTAAEAERELANSNLSLAQQISGSLQPSLDKLDETMNRLIQAEQDKFAKEQSIRQESSQRAANKASFTAASVSGLLGLPSQITSKEDVVKAKNASVELSKLKEKLDKQANFDTFRQTAGTIIRDNELTETEKQGRLLAEAKRGFPGLNEETFKNSDLFTGKRPVIGKGIIDISNDERLNSTRESILNAGGTIGLDAENEKAKNNIISNITATFGITADKAITAAQNLAQVNKELDEISKSDVSRFSVVAQRPQPRASGGFISGPNINRDIIPAMLMPGEFVMRKSAVDSIGVSTLSAMNNGSVSGFASGGFADDIRRRLDAKKEADRRAIEETAKQVKIQQDRKAQLREQAVTETNAQLKAISDRKASIPKIRRGDHKAAQSTAGHDKFFLQALSSVRQKREQAAAAAEFQKTAPKASLGTRTPVSSSISGFTPTKAAANITTSGGNNVTAGTTGNVGQLQQVALQFNSTIDKLSETLGNLQAIQHEHTITGKVEVIINGDSALKALAPELQNMVTAKIGSAIRQWANKNFPGQTKEVDFSKE